MQKMEAVIKNILNKDINKKVTKDIILSEFFKNEMLVANKLKIIQMRMGLIYEELAKFHNWTKVDKIDLVDIDKKIALEIKSSTNTDNSSSRERNYQKLLEFKSKHNNYKLYYVCINYLTKNPQNKILANGITLLTGEFALQFLYGDNNQNVITTIQKCIKIFIQSDTFKMREVPKASITTLSEKFDKGSQVMTDSESNNLEDITMGNPQQSF